MDYNERKAFSQYQVKLNINETQYYYGLLLSKSYYGAKQDLLKCCGYFGDFIQKEFLKSQFRKTTINLDMKKTSKHLGVIMYMYFIHKTYIHTGKQIIHSSKFN